MLLACATSAYVAGCTVGDEGGPGFGYVTTSPGSSASAADDSSRDSETDDDGDAATDGVGADDDGGWPGGSDDGGAETTGDPAEPLGSCCDPSNVGGCDSPAVEACVCQADPACCQDAWSPACVKQVETLGCGKCPGDGGGGGGPAGDCCQANGTPGCVDAAVEACVCAQDPDCCQTEWDALCAQGVEALGCGNCGGGGGGGGGGCCQPAQDAGCGDLVVEVCVCTQDPYCCFVEWDAQCVDQVSALGCGTC